MHSTCSIGALGASNNVFAHGLLHESAKDGGSDKCNKCVKTRISPGTRNKGSKSSTKNDVEKHTQQMKTHSKKDLQTVLKR